MLNHKWQNRMLLVASYVFYGSWDWRFLSLIVISTVIDYICGLKIHYTENNRKRKLFLAWSIFTNLSLLGFFKYFNFFASNLQTLMNSLGFSIQPHFLNIILPVGISFYTFQTMSYTIDIYRKEMEPTRKFFDFALFVAFFPQLVAGPIERARHLLPQMLVPRKLNLEKFYKGSYLIFWGLFLKIFIADNLALIVNPVFSAAPPYNGIKVLIALYAFAFQIFCDFAGYSTIARGLGACMGFDIMINFNLPYFATNPSEFWRRWHISLSRWLRDYLYIPLGGNKKGLGVTYRNLALTMLLGGLWHGAAWTFIVWGAYQGLLLIVHRLLQPLLAKGPKPKTLFGQRLWVFVRMAFFFQLVCLGWLIFRATSMAQLFDMLHGLFFNFNLVSGVGLKSSLLAMLSVLWILVIIQMFQYWKDDLHVIYTSPTWIKALVYVAMYLCVMSIETRGGNEFIYFQF